MMEWKYKSVGSFYKSNKVMRAMMMLDAPFRELP